MHESTEVGVVIFQQPNAGWAVDLECITADKQFVSFKLETVDGTQRCYLQVTVKGDSQLK